MASDHIELIVRLSLGIVFGVSAGAKLRDPWEFARGVSQYRLFPTGVPRGLALAVIPTEAVFAICHATGVGLVAVAPLCLVVLGAFTVAVAVQLASGHRVPCMCFDPGGQELISGGTVVRLVLLIAAELYVFVLAFDRTVRQPASLIEMSISFALATVVVASARWAINATDLAQLLRPLPRPPLDSTSSRF